MQVKSLLDKGYVVTESARFGKLRSVNRRCHGVCLSVVSLVLFSVSSVATAVGLGAADARSYIGQPIDITVPLFNVENPDSLDVELVSDSADARSRLRAEIDRSNSQLAIRISSDQHFNEPYLDFTLDLLDDGNAYSKAFTVLLDLAPNTNPDPATATVASLETAEIRSYDIAPPAGKSVLGPYQWAQKGNIPAKFGAVLDGQSLWRVARRINAAMGVSLNQMMWALYQENPHAFTDDSVSSLQAGSYLRIPSRQQVLQVSDAQAKAELAKPSLIRHAKQTQPSSTATQPLAAPVDVDNTPPAALVNESSQGVASVPAFDVSGLDATRFAGSATASDQSQTIISSLAQTVGNLTQELISKDKKISFLEEKVAALESYAGIDSESLASQQDKLVDKSVAAEQISQVSEPSESSAVVDNEMASRWTLGQVLAFAAMIILITGFMFRLRLAELWSSLNIFGNSSDLEFASVLRGGRQQSSQERTSDGDKPHKDYSVLHAVDHPEHDKEAIDGISYLSLKDDGRYVETAVEPDSVMLIDDDADLSFSERFDRLLQEKDYEFARELLDFARYNEIDDQLYHCGRLRLFKAMQDEDGFYEYYYEIESKIPQFDPQLQTTISQLVVQLAHH